MKKLFLFTLFLLSFGIANAQTDSLAIGDGKKEIDLTGKNELKVNLLSVAFGLPEFSYERILKGKKGIGLSAFIATEADNDYNFGFMPYFRWYLGQPKSIQFFIEANMAAISGEGYSYSNNGSSYVIKDLFGVGLGGAVGVKIISKKSLMFDAYLGSGRALGAVRSFRKYDRIGLTIGKRF